MKILIYDKMQIATGVPDQVKSPALSDFYETAASFTATFTTAEKIDCIGIGYTDATQVTITNESLDSRSITISKDAPYQNGLYLLSSAIYPTDLEYGGVLTITHNGTYIGRVAIGEYRKLCGNPSMEIGFYTTEKNRDTLAMQVIPGAGGVSGRVFDFDVRYEIDIDNIYADIELAFASQIAKGFPFFMYTDDEQHKLPTNMLYFYAKTDKPISKLQNSIRRALYSYKFKFEERF